MQEFKYTNYYLIDSLKLKHLNFLFKIKFFLKNKIECNFDPIEKKFQNYFIIRFLNLYVFS